MNEMHSSSELYSSRCVVTCDVTTLRTRQGRKVKDFKKLVLVMAFRVFGLYLLQSELTNHVGSGGLGGRPSRSHFDTAKVRLDTMKAHLSSSDWPLSITCCKTLRMIRMILQSDFLDFNKFRIS
jgi:hypothetical protein